LVENLMDLATAHDYLQDVRAVRPPRVRRSNVSDDVLSVIPIDPYWQPDPTAGDTATAIVRALAPDPDGVTVEIRTSWHETVTLVDCGANLERIGCPACGANADTEWWQDLMEARYEDGFHDLSTHMPVGFQNPRYLLNCRFADGLAGCL
jgi:hypothetical protein